MAMFDEEFKRKIKGRDFWIFLIGVIVTFASFLLIVYYRTGAFKK